jgi:hypothetical protein
MPRLSDCGGWSALGWEATVVTGCTFIGLFVGTYVGTTVGISFYRRHHSSKTTTAT